MLRLLRLLIPAPAVLAAALCASESAPAAMDERGLPLIRNFPPTIYNGANQVWSGVALDDGTMLFGNNNQVLEFDGQTWRPIGIPGGAHIRGLGVDPAGNVWAAGVNELGRIETAPDGQRVFKSLRALVPKEAGDLGTIWQVHATADGIWFQGNAVTLRWRDGKFDHWPTGEKFIVLSFWLGDHLLVATTKGWFRPGEGGRWDALGRPEDKLGDYLPHFAVPHPQGGWLMCLEGPKGEVVGLARWDGQRLQFEPHPLDPLFKSKRLYGATRLADGRYVLTTLQGGAVLTDANLRPEFHLGEKAGLESEAVICAVPDRHGALWLGTEWGLSRVEVHPAYTWFGPLNGLSRRATLTMFRERWHGRLLVPGAQGLMRLEPPEATPGQAVFKRWSEIDDKVWCMLPDGENLIVGGLGGICLLDATGKRTFLRSGSNIFGLVLPGRDADRLYAASLNGLVVLQRKDGAWTRLETIGKIRGNSIAEASDGTLWLGTDNQGIWRVRITTDAAGKIEADGKLFGPAEAGLPPGGNRSEVVKLDDNLLFLTSGGPMRFNATGGRFEPEPGFGRQFIDGTYAISSIAAGAGGGHWVVATGGGDNPAGRPTQVGLVRDGKFEVLPLPEPGRIGGRKELWFETKDGRDVLWIMGQSALLRIDLTTLHSNRPPPIGSSLLSGITVGGARRLPLGAAPVQLKSGENNLRFSFATPGLAGVTDPVHESVLHGFADGALERRVESERTFTNLPPGSYVFEARGRSADGRWSEPARFAFTVLAPWWQTPWAIAAWVASGGFLLFAYIRWRIRGLRRERARLAAVVAERTAELAQKNLELERLHRLDQDEKLSARLAEEKAQLELLRYQLNPHFLYNSLNSIRALVYSNAEAAGEMVTRLSEFCRATLTRRADDVTTVGEEAEMLQAYLDIERTRWQTGLAARIEIDPAARGEPLPQFLLLPLLENAIKYGGKTSPALLEVVVSARVEDDELVCEVANTGEWVELNGETPRESTRIGLENLRRRIARHYGLGREVQVTKGGGWVRVTLRLPRVARTADAENAAG